MICPNRLSTHVARKGSLGGEAIILDGGFNGVLQLPVPADEHAEVLLFAEDGGECLGEMLDALFRTQAADVADKRRAVGVGGGYGEGGEVEEVLPGDEDLVFIHDKIPCTGQRSGINNNVIDNEISATY